MSAHLQWTVLWNCSIFLIMHNKQTYSTDPNNLKARNSFRYNGLIHRNTVGIEPAADGKGIVMVLKHRAGQRKPATSYVRTTINKNAQATHIIRKNKYRKDLHMAALRQASAILRSQKSVVVKKKQTAHPRALRGPDLPLANKVKLLQKKKTKEEVEGEHCTHLLLLIELPVLIYSNCTPNTAWILGLILALGNFLLCLT
ncbi:60S ribosomal protein L28-like [Dromiciops gliroides]|uniref:60S ribosomal protein L28-like n=1 Tax=Dromiciops gliroides TaxID=33562 RepID=UPI001CC371BE|nr:60S ribosomal protein L28-like [Dromiciops gliroides]